MPFVFCSCAILLDIFEVQQTSRTKQQRVITKVVEKNMSDHIYETTITKKQV